VRVISGRFEKGMKVKNARTQRTLTLAAPQQLFANERRTVEEGYAGDVIGVTSSAGSGQALAIGAVAILCLEE
jgi:peptide chain release factor 3